MDCSRKALFRYFCLLLLCPFVLSGVQADQTTVFPPEDSTLGAQPQLQQRIVGGVRSDEGQWPWMVALARTQESLRLVQRQSCGGTAIASRWVLTAAHCLVDLDGQQIPNTDIRAVAGINNLRTQAPNVEDEVLITNIIIHPDYDPDDFTSQNDIALLEVATDLNVQAIALYAGDAAELAGQNSTTIGWGARRDSETNPQFPDALRHVDVPVVSLSVCNGPSSYQGNLTENQICAGRLEGGVDSCSGDSGGPLIVNSDESEEDMQVGIVSFGNGCALPNFPGVYTNVAAYSDWIRGFIGEPVNNPDDPARQGNETALSSPQRGEFRFGGGYMLFLLLAVYSAIYSALYSDLRNSERI